MGGVEATGKTDGGIRTERTAYPNIVWLLTDSIRNYPGEEGDIRGKLPFMERFGRDAVEFATCVTTAPSTIMSVTAMMTGLPAYFVARNYENFRFDSGYGHSLAGVLKEHGYSSWAFLRGMETREKFSTFLDPVPRRFWPKDLRHGTKWRNADLDRLLDRVLSAGVPTPAFLFFHYNPRTEAETDHHLSERVEATWERICGAGLTPDNTIFVLCSDHGYPASSTGINTEWEIKSRITHDLVLSDDNILMPLYIRYPGCSPAKIDTPVSSLDLFPTLLELAGIPERDGIQERIDGETLVPLIMGRDEAYGRRFFRCDSRLMLQSARSTAIRGREFKYVRFHDEHRLSLGNVAQQEAEVLIDLRGDKSEERNLLGGDDLSPGIQEVLDELRSEFERTEQRGLELQVDYLLWRQRRRLHSRTKPTDGTARILLAFEPDTSGYLQIGLKTISRLRPAAEVHLLADRKDVAEETLRQVSRFHAYAREEHGRLEAPDLTPEANSPGGREPYDLTLLFVQDPDKPIVSELLRIVKSVRSRKRLVVDCNFNAYRGDGYWLSRTRALLRRLPKLVEEPRTALGQAKIAVSLLRRRVLQRLGRWERWEATDAPAAQDEE